MHSIVVSQLVSSRDQCAAFRLFARRNTDAATRKPVETTNIATVDTINAIRPALICVRSNHTSRFAFPRHFRTDLCDFHGLQVRGVRGVPPARHTGNGHAATKGRRKLFRYNELSSLPRLGHTPIGRYQNAARWTALFRYGTESTIWTLEQAVHDVAANRRMI